MPITTPNAGDPWTTQGGQILTALNNFETADAEYNTATNQTMPTGADTPILFGTDNRTCSLVTKSTYGVGHQFTLGRTGLWMFTATIRWMWNERGNDSTQPGERFIRIYHVTPAVVLGSAGVVQGAFTGPTTLNVSAYRFMNSGDIVAITGYHDAGSNRSLESNNGGAYGRVNLAWLHA